MKRISLIAFVLTAMMTACKSSDDNVIIADTKNGLVKEIRETTNYFDIDSPNLGELTEGFFNNKIISIKYNSNNTFSSITNTVAFRDRNENIIRKEVKKTFTYIDDSTLLLRERIESKDFSYTKNFTYNTNKQVDSIIEPKKITTFAYDSQKRVNFIYTYHTDNSRLNSTQEFFYDEFNIIDKVIYSTSANSKTLQITHQFTPNCFKNNNINYALSDFTNTNTPIPSFVHNPDYKEEYYDLFNNIEYCYKGQFFIRNVNYKGTAIYESELGLLLNTKEGILYKKTTSLSPTYMKAFF
ncbi:MAG: hypothetical protein LBI73_00400 [Myroides sp.]|jgi:hypothetical protein|nr:hypothetical protein [Myroides sp.]